MPEPTSTAAGLVTVATAAVSTSVLTAFGVPLGLRVDLLIAGFAGSLVAIILLNTVPDTGDTWLELFRTTRRRMAVAFASSVTAGYTTPLALLAANVPEALLLSMAFLVGACAQRVLVSFADRYFPQQPGPPPAPPDRTGGAA